MQSLTFITTATLTFKKLPLIFCVMGSFGFTLFIKYLKIGLTKNNVFGNIATYKQCINTAGILLKILKINHLLHQLHDIFRAVAGIYLDKTCNSYQKHTPF